MSASPTWDSVATFLAVMRGGSLSAAAREMGLAQPTVRRHVEGLEAALGVVLFTRAPTGLTPTDAALQALPFAEAMAGAAAALARGAAHTAEAVAGTLRLSCSEIMAIEVIPALLAPLLDAHPALEVELVASDRQDDLLRRDADMAVRMARPIQAGLVARKAGDIRLGLYAREDYLARLPVLRSVADLVAHARLIGQDRETGIADSLAAIAPASTPSFMLRSDSNAVQLAAIRAGLGVGICQQPIADADPRLRAMLPALGTTIECWVVMHEDLRAQRRARVVFDHLVAALADYARPGAVPGSG